jgi:GNAT superfamily N-acetyltransferase
MINELALYEKEPDAVEATESLLLSTLSFAVSPNTHAQPRLSSLTPAQRSGEEEILEPISDRKTARTLLLFEGEATEGGIKGRPVGMALYFFTYSTWKAAPGIYLEDLFVREEVRGRGYGKALIRRLAQLVSLCVTALFPWF